MRTADGERVRKGATVWTRVGGPMDSLRVGCWRVSELTVIRLTDTRVRCERVNGRLGCWRKPENLYGTRAAATGEHDADAGIET